jgi:AraC-like DNA-binding protein
MEPPARYEFRTVVPGVETLPPCVSRPRHHHRAGYATVVLAGAFTEVSFAGRMEAEPGDVLLHGAFDCHLDIARSRGPLQILRLPWRNDTREGKFRVEDPDILVRLAEMDCELAAAQLSHELCLPKHRDPQWIDDLATALTGDSAFLLQEWADRHALRADAISRVFRREFGVSAQRFRLESRTRLAWRHVVGSGRSLTEIALEGGFSDLAHMSRSIRVFTGHSPSAWRARPWPSQHAGGGQVRSSARRLPRAD